jgi:hypothetical protein
MAAPVIPCDSCGSPIPDSDLETGTAITLLGKRYCVGCKTEAIQAVSLDDLASKPAPTRPAAPRTAARPAPIAARAAPPAAPPPASKSPPKPSPKAAPPASASAKATADKPGAAPAERKSAPRRPAPAAKQPNRTPLMIAVVAAGILAVLAAVFVYKGGSASPRETNGSGKPETSPGSTPNRPAADRETQARNAFLKVEELTRRSGVSWDLVIAAADKAKPDCRGTEWEKKLEEIRSRAAHEKENEDAAKDLAPMVDELRGAVTTDPEFKRFAELQPKFQLALDIAGRTSTAKMPEIRALRAEYNGKYEKLAEPHYDRIHEAAVSLADERRYDDALRQIDSFPQNLRHSGSWMTLEKLRQDIERRKKSQPKK